MISRTSSAAVLAATTVLAGAAGARADVTAEQVWSDWRGYMADAGYTVRATEERSGDVLTVTDLTMTFEVPEEDSTVTMTMGEMTFTDNGDGTVALGLPADLPIGVVVEGPEGEEADVGLNYATTGLSINVSGDPDDMTYTYSAAMVGLSLDRLAVEGETVDMAEFGTAELSLANVAGSTRMVIGELRRSIQKVSSGAITYLVDINEPEGGDGHVVVRGGADSMDLKADVSLPEDMDTEEMSRMLAAGFAIDGSFSIEGGNTSFDFTDDEEAVQGSSSSAMSGLRVVMNKERVLYSGDAEALEISMAGGDLPFPVEIGAEDTGFTMDMPVARSEEMQDFALAMRLGGVSVSEMIWGMIDPGGQLPHDPATVAFDISGTAKLFVDLFDPDQMAKIDTGESLPGELNSLQLNDLTVSAAGAELTGAGAFTFDNSDLETFEGMPAPSGEVNLKLVGGNGLLDKLVGMGLVPEEEASGMRMMMGLFAVPGEGEDTLTSTIEVRDDGQILANGQRLQ
ncbi:DUF2125 domain-containing protein [Roseovarius salis]|uniref:DUF2125 domain-containing protein n=1 Tax=Roseovarius salis TaxID=3376063 RepID=UPI0037C8C137